MRKDLQLKLRILVKSKRHEMNLSSAKFAMLAGVSPRVIHHIEYNASFNVKPHDLRQILDFINMYEGNL